MEGYLVILCFLYFFSWCLLVIFLVYRLLCLIWTVLILHFVCFFSSSSLSSRVTCFGYDICIISQIFFSIKFFLSSQSWFICFSLSYLAEVLPLSSPLSSPSFLGFFLCVKPQFFLRAKVTFTAL